MASKTKYTFVDLENVHPDKLPIAANEKVFVFVGTGQKSIKKELVIPLQKLGKRGEYIEITGTGKNALDFHIAFYMGEIAAKDPDCELCIISNDTGYDPLIAHIKDKYKIKASRKPGNAKAGKKAKATPSTIATAKTTKKVAKVKAVKQPKTTDNTTATKTTAAVNQENIKSNITETYETIKKVIAILEGVSPKANKPKTVTALKNRIKIMPGLAKLSNQEISYIIERLEVRDYLEIQDTGRIEYK